MNAPRAGNILMLEALFVGRILPLGWVPQKRDDGTTGGVYY